MSFLFKKITIPLVLLSFLTMAFFSFASMAYGPDGRMQGDCPFSSLGTALCPQGALPGAIHHILGSQSFLNVPINPITVFLMLASAGIVFLFLLPLYKPLTPLLYRSPPCTSQDRKTRRWLSLFEHSPSH